jgi:hypothetical protein
MAMLLAAVCAEGTSTINNADQIERGYERIDDRLNALGARITRVPARIIILIVHSCSFNPLRGDSTGVFFRTLRRRPCRRRGPATGSFARA